MVWLHKLPGTKHAEEESREQRLSKYDCRAALEEGEEQIRCSCEQTHESGISVQIQPLVLKGQTNNSKALFFKMVG